MSKKRKLQEVESYEIESPEINIQEIEFNIQEVQENQEFEINLPNKFHV
jgi:hypothetical protein